MQMFKKKFHSAKMHPPLYIRVHNWRCCVIVFTKPLGNDALQNAGGSFIGRRGAKHPSILSWLIVAWRWPAFIADSTTIPYMFTCNVGQFIVPFLENIVYQAGWMKKCYIYYVYKLNGAPNEKRELMRYILGCGIFWVCVCVCFLTISNILLAVG